MKRLLTVATLVAALSTAAACRQANQGLEIQAGSDVTVEKKDGGKVAGRLVEIKPAQLTVEARDGAKTLVNRADIVALRAATPPPAAAPASAAPAPEAADPTGATPQPAYREVTIPLGTTLPLDLLTPVSSDGSKVEDRVRAKLRRPLTINGVQALPAGATVVGHVTAAERSARVKGRAFVSFRFTSIDPPGDAERMAIRTDAITRFAPATKKQDAAKIGGGAVGGAIVGGILGGGDGAAKGAAIGGAAGTGVVLSTRGREIRLSPGTAVSARLARPVTVRVPER